MPYRGQRLAGASRRSSCTCCKKVRGHPDPSGGAAGPPARYVQLCSAPIGLGTFEIDHVIPWPSPSADELQALCIECHRTKTSLESNHSTWRAGFVPTSTRTTRPRRGCRRWSSSCGSGILMRGHRCVPLPKKRLVLASRWRCFGERLGRKPVFAYMLEAELAQWQHFKWSLDATAHVNRPAAHGAQLARRRGAQCKAGHQQPRGPVCSESRASLLHEDFKSSGGWGGLQLHDAGGHGPVCFATCLT